MVKSDALFSYIAPANIIGWVLTPLRYIIPFRQFVKLNRTIIKVTHLPLLLAICGYERLILSRRVFEPMDLVEQRGRRMSRVPAAFAVAKDAELFSPGARLREPSVTTFRKDRALEEVFRRPFRSSTANKPRVEQQPTKSANVVQDWMRGMEGAAASPSEQPRDVLERLETRRPGFRRHKTAQGLYTYRQVSANAVSAISDPEDARILPPRVFNAFRQDSTPNLSLDDLPQQTDEDAGDELASNEDDEHHSEDDPSTHAGPSGGDMRQHNVKQSWRQDEEEDYFRTPTASKSQTPLFHTAATRQEPRSPVREQSPTRPRTAQRHRHKHSRNASSGTILFSPLNTDKDDAGTRSPVKPGSPSKRKSNASAGTRSGTATPSGKRHPLGLQPLTNISNSPAKPRAILSARDDRRPNFNLPGLLALNSNRREPSFNARALDLASDLGDNRAAPNFNILEALPASFGTQFELATRKQQHGGGDGDTTRRLNKLMLARMSTLEQGFAEVLKEVKGLSRGASSIGNSSVEGESRGKGKRKVAIGKVDRPAATRMAQRDFGQEDTPQAVPGASSVPDDELVGFGDDTAASRSSV
jgi:hypothetical protein